MHSAWNPSLGCCPVQCAKRILPGEPRCHLCLRLRLRIESDKSALSSPTSHAAAASSSDDVMAVHFLSKCIVPLNQARGVFPLEELLMHHEDYFSLSGGLSSGTFSLQGQMRGILVLLQLTLRNDGVSHHQDRQGKCHHNLPSLP
ncbi:hypothetical protein NL676_028701 [Syzygium grande]|nr:hypothetical protein NL676_028701 [Syzygium grande]